MIKELIILTKSRKHHGYCIAGVDTRTGEWIRIISDDSQSSTDAVTEKQLTYNNGKVADVLDIVQVKYKKANPYYYQPENYILDSTSRFTKIGVASIQDVLDTHNFEKKDFIYFNTEYKIEDSSIRNINNKNMYSLILVKVKNPYINVSIKPWSTCDEKNVTLNFSYKHHTYRYFRITDEDFDSYYEYDEGDYQLNGDYALVISLGELYGRNSSHYKLVAKIFEL